MEKKRRTHFPYIALLLLLAIVGFWQIAFLKYSVEHDMINCWIPWRYYISQCFRHHIFPFWNPYQQLGYPIHADLQGPTWYAESLLLSMTTGQTNYTLHFLFIFYVFMAGMGMYFLSLCFQPNRNAAFTVAACYMLGGFFVAHVQHFYAVIGAAWLPFILLNYYRMHTQKSYLHALYTAVFMFFNLTGGNHTFSIILVYLFALIAGYFIVSAWREKNRAAVIRYVKLNALFAVVTLCMATVVLVAFAQTAPYVARLSGMSYQNAAVAPFSPQSLLSFLFPFTTVGNSDFFNTDPSMCNMYVGLLAFVFIVPALFAKKSGLEKLLLAFALLCLFTSFGAYTPVHKLVFRFLPFMNLFRFPSYFSLFFVVLILLPGAKQLGALANAEPQAIKRTLRIAAVLALLVAGCIVFALLRNHSAPLFFLEKYAGIFDFLRASSFYQNIILQGGIQLLLLAALLAVLLSPLKKYALPAVTLLIVTDLLIATQLNIANVGVSPLAPKELHDYILKLPQDFPIPADRPVAENSDASGAQHGLYRNTGIFLKQISGDVFNSYAFRNYAMLRDSLPYLYNAMLRNRPVYFSDEVYPLNGDGAPRLNDSATVNERTIALSNADYRAVAAVLEAGGNAAPNAQCAITAFSPNAITIRGSASRAQLLTLLQSYYKGWEVSIDGKPQQIMVSNYLTMSVLFPAGTHEVKFMYRNPAIVTAGIISYGSFFIVLAILSINWIRRRNYLAPLLIWCVPAGALLYYFL